MILTIDVGNTHVVFGLYDEDLVASWRIASDRQKTEDEYGIIFKTLLEHQGIHPQNIHGAIISSVVPGLTPLLEAMCEKYLSVKPMSVGPGIKTGINIKYENPREVGADRIANVVAAHHKYGGPLIVVDFGTATTFDALAANLDYLGGAIAPGISISTEALSRSAAKLSKIEIAKPDAVIGKNTISSMQSGVFYGYVGLVESIVERMKAEMGGGKIFTVATGGLAPLICSETKDIDAIDMMLTLDGLKLIYDKNVNGA